MTRWDFPLFLVAKKEGESCGKCFNADIGNNCGKCSNGLICQPGDPLLPDAPGKCVKNEDLKGNQLKTNSPSNN